MLRLNSIPSKSRSVDKQSFHLPMNPNTNATPRTDAEQLPIGSPFRFLVAIDLARQLERELNEVKQHLKDAHANGAKRQLELEAEIGRLKDCLNQSESENAILCEQEKMLGGLDVCDNCGLETVHSISTLDLVKERDALKAELSTVKDTAIDLLTNRKCSAKHKSENLSISEFAELGGIECPMCLKAEVEELRKDKQRLDWLANKENEVGHVMLPTKCVLENMHSMRGAIDAAMKGQP